MSELILHHYPMSPFSEKVRLVLGYKGLSWHSVIVPATLPKPEVMALTGGYRRTPFMQRGADIYCDTALMCRVLDRWHPEPALTTPASAGLEQIVAQWADTALFWTAVPYTLQPAGVGHVMQGATPQTLQAFAADRAAMNPSMRRATLADGAAALGAYLGRLEQMLDAHPFLLGTCPCIADFAAAQSVWFVRLAPPVATVLQAYPRIQAWFERVAAFGHGNATPMDAEQAIGRAAQGAHEPLSFVPEAGLQAHAAVTVTPTDYAHDAVAGRLVGLGPDEVVIARDDARAGLVHVHFPRIAYQIKLQTP
jgi:glutathione S-transferase